MDIHDRLKDALDNKASSKEVMDILNECDDPECIECGELICPSKEPLHFHHDGCPVCDVD